MLEGMSVLSGRQSPAATVVAAAAPAPVAARPPAAAANAGECEKTVVIAKAPPPGLVTRIGSAFRALF
jgi:hypothetical protein